MITEYILFDLPAGTSRAELVTAMREVAPRWQNAKELIRKTFLYDPAGNQTGAFYLWETREAAELAHDQAWREQVKRRWGSEPVIRYFDTPLVVDNALGRVVEAASSGEPTAQDRRG